MLDFAIFLRWIGLGLNRENIPFNRSFGKLYNHWVEIAVTLPIHCKLEEIVIAEKSIFCQIRYISSFFHANLDWFILTYHSSFFRFITLSYVLFSSDQVNHFIQDYYQFADCFLPWFPFQPPVSHYAIACELQTWQPFQNVSSIDHCVLWITVPRWHQLFILVDISFHLQVTLTDEMY